MPLRILLPAALAWFLFMISTVVVVRAEETAAANPEPGQPVNGDAQPVNGDAQPANGDAQPANINGLIANVDQLIVGGKYDEAIVLARKIDQLDDDSRDVTLSFARLARGLQQSSRIKEAAEFYQRSVEASAQPAAASLPSETIVLIRLAAGSALAQANEFEKAIAALSPLVTAEFVANKDQRRIAVSVLLKIGSASLGQGVGATAANAYSQALASADEQQRPTAMLGMAWGSAIMRDRPAAAADQLTDFLNEFPDHPDAARAARACVECCKQAGLSERANAMRSALFQRWPDSDSTWSVAMELRNQALDLVPDAMSDWLMVQATSDQLERMDDGLTVLALQIANRRQNLKAWSALAKHLASRDTKGQAVSDALSSLNDSAPAAAERLAATLISPQAGQPVTPEARESASRWAARNERWSMLALASDSESLQESSNSRTPTVERLMAEALVQSGRTQDALAWWNHVVDQRAVSDFATLIRCAEAETSVGRDVGLAKKRIDAARQAAGKDRFQLALVHLLDAELSIRNLKFDDARARLESVVRESDTDVSLRGRAQWLIGETYFLQQDFANAIEAYRRVEGIDPDGIWVSAALVQAGKSFEQLGRKREASVCYGYLLRRFANTTHAATARRRMAALNEPNTDTSSETIRR